MESHAKNLQVGGAARKTTPPVDDPNIKALEEELTRSLGLAVEMKTRSGGGGELRIRFNRPEELDGVIRRLRSYP
jgi:ParB family chromosome partitioning protein